MRPTAKRKLRCRHALLPALLGLWLCVQYAFIARRRARDATVPLPPLLPPRATDAPSASGSLLPITNQHPSDGLANPNHLPKLPRFGPASFYDVLAPPYYAKSPVDGSRDFAPGSALAAAHCPVAAVARTAVTTELQSYVAQGKARVIPRDERLCSHGPVGVLPFLNTSHASAYEFGEACVTFNLDSAKRVQRALVLFDPLNNAPLRCVPCPNPLMFATWGEHACGIMWAHQINAKSIGDLHDCYAAHEADVARVSQRQAPLHGARSLVGVRYPGRTLVLSYAYSNPGHQLFDSILTLLPVLLAHADHVVDHVVIHQGEGCPEHEWICAILTRLGMFRKPGAVLPLFPGTVSCFERVVVPRYALGRMSSPTKYFSRHALALLQARLKESFGLVAAPARAPRLLVYAHATLSKEAMVFRRAWLDLNSSVAAVAGAFDVRVVDDFAALPVLEQARAFHEADLVVMPHGGQFGNAIFARAGSVLVELSCTRYTHIGQDGGWITRAFGLVHVVARPCDCDKATSLDSNFRFASLRQAWAEYKGGPAGTVKREGCWE